MQDEVISTLEQKIASVSSSATYVAGSTAAVVGTWTANGWAAIAGAIVAVATFFVNWYYKSKAYKLEERRLELETRG
jgi:hypothetical protein